ncbi:hypothetical protein ALI22I_40160 [Saccharothrix sp. ALI-22-I]|uniref:hypothetical protein n=1 Tax=Saccharothrix sp. ALI-22-I TaxID=1933778 RepID=UPI00097BBAC7|nr:hypothetical protein [Saccharothrix sp. ALI-22-I]ONI82330.1 hypothetical protein ALI22I_40160 [Saccharothrix sp. ALI-22-I]
MSEADLREGLRAAIGDEPPLNFDAEELIQRAEHVRKRRRALVAVAVATLALTGTVLSLPGVFDQRPGIDVGQAPVLTITASPSPSQQPATMEPPSLLKETRPTTVPAGVRTVLSEVLTKQFVDVVPGAKVVEIDFADVLGQDQAAHLVAIVRFVDGVGPSEAVVELNAPAQQVTRDQFCAVAKCDEPVRQDDGSHLEFATVTNPGVAMMTYRVAHFRADGSVVEVSAYNYDPMTGVLRADVAVTTDQLVRLATDPKLTMW